MPVCSSPTSWTLFRTPSTTWPIATSSSPKISVRRAAKDFRFLLMSSRPAVHSRAHLGINAPVACGKMAGAQFFSPHQQGLNPCDDLPRSAFVLSILGREGRCACVPPSRRSAPVDRYRYRHRCRYIGTGTDQHGRSKEWRPSSRRRHKSKYPCARVLLPVSPARLISRESCMVIHTGAPVGQSAGLLRTHCCSIAHRAGRGRSLAV